MKVTTFIAPVVISVVILTSCSNKKQDSLYSDILNKSPFAALTDSIEKDPGNDSLYSRRAILLNEKDFREPALADFRSAWSIKKSEKYALGISTLLLEMNTDSAILFLEKTLPLLPESNLLRLSLARAYDDKGRTKEAVSIADEILKNNPQQVDILKFKAGILEKQGSKQDAVNLLERAYAIAPYDIELNYILALKLAEAGNSKVLALCDSLIKVDTLQLHAEPYYYKGIYYASLNDKTKAISFFDQASKLDIHFMEAYIEKGSLLFEMKKIAEARSVFMLALNIAPDYPDTYYWLGKCDEAEGKTAEAKLNFDKAKSLEAAR